VAVLLREGRTNPASPYGISKLAEENAAFHLGKLLGIPVVALRYSNVEGPRQSSYNGASGICGSFTQALQEGKPFAMLEDGKQLRDYVHVSDAVEASLLAMEDARADGQVFNVGTGRGITVVDFVRVLTQKTKAQISPEISGTYRLGDARHAISSVARLQGLGWKPKKGLGEIFDDYVEWLASVIGLRDSAAAGAGSPLEALEDHGVEEKHPAEVPAI
jgi:dTDP-L-rhamnose 4-epimerase